MFLVIINKQYLRTLLNTLFEGITNHTFKSTGLCFLYKLIVNTFMYKCTWSSTTALSLQIKLNHFHIMKFISISLRNFKVLLNKPDWRTEQHVPNQQLHQHWHPHTQWKAISHQVLKSLVLSCFLQPIQERFYQLKLTPWKQATKSLLKKFTLM